jgi:hypothetical protein
MRRTGKGRFAAMHEMHLACPLVTPESAPRVLRRLAGQRGRPCTITNLWKGGDRLTVTVSLVLLLGVAVFLLCKYAGLKIWHAAVCVILGFYLASTSFAPLHFPVHCQPVPQPLER